MDRSEELELARIMELLELSDFDRRKVRMESELATLRSTGVTLYDIVAKARIVAKAAANEPLTENEAFLIRNHADAVVSLRTKLQHEMAERHAKRSSGEPSSPISIPATIQAEPETVRSDPRQPVSLVQEHPPVKTLDDLPEYSPADVMIWPHLLREWRDGRIKVKGEERPKMTRAKAEAADAAVESRRRRRGTTWMS